MALASLSNSKQSRTTRLFSNFFSVQLPGFRPEGLEVIEYRLSFSDKAQSPSFYELTCALSTLHPFFLLSGDRLVSLNNLAPSESFTVSLSSGEILTVVYVGRILLPSGSPELLRVHQLALQRHTDARPSHVRVGRFFFDAGAKNDSDRSSLHVVSGFHASVDWYGLNGGYMLHCDTVYRAVHRKTLLETIGGASEEEWTRRCVNSLVLTVHNNRVYRVKQVLLGQSPNSTFLFKEKRRSKTGGTRQMSYIEFYRRFYNRWVYDLQQPLIEAYSEKKEETVILIPELCCLTGLTEDMRKDRVLMNDLLAFSMVSGGNKLGAAVAVARSIGANPVSSTGSTVLSVGGGSAQTRGGRRMSNGPSPVCTPPAVPVPGGADIRATGVLQISEDPMMVEGRVLEPVEVQFGTKRYMVEDGNFQRFSRAGSNCPVRVHSWIVVYPDQDRSLVMMWLRSMREIGASAFGMSFEEPDLVVCSNQSDELTNLLMDKVKPPTQLVLLFTPQKDARRVYQILKRVTTSDRPCITQVIKSETMRKRQSIVAVVTRVVMQISAKLMGPLWNVSFEGIKAMQTPCMLVGVDICQNKETRKSVLGFVASTDAFATQFFSDAIVLMDNPGSSVGPAITKCLTAALAAFSERNEGSLPSNIVVFRGSVQKADVESVGNLETEAVVLALKQTKTQSSQGEPVFYTPGLVYVICTANVSARFYQPMGSNDLGSPQPGTVIDGGVSNNKFINFYMVNQHVARGTAIPSHYVVAFNNSNIETDQLQSLIFRLAHNYLNLPGAIRLPCPTQYARKLAHLVGSTILAPVHPRLRETLFYL
jgi:aubergine-like protein